MEVRQQFAKLLRECRRARDLSQEETAVAAQISVVYLSKLESGLASPTLDVITNLCIALDVHSADLISLLKVRKLKPGMDWRSE